jgi:hypothetical protein
MKCFCFKCKRLRFWRRGKNVNIKIDRIDNKINNINDKIQKLVEKKCFESSKAK